jgi:leader peptidase (prepilin peptidase)/N-methyltransferase
VSPSAPLSLAFVVMLITVSVTDLERRIIPNRVLLVSSSIGLAGAAVIDPSSIPERLAAALSAGGTLLIAALLRPDGMGMGDVKLAAAMGIFLGAAVAPALLLALLAATFAGVALVIRDGAGARRRSIPFGPFLALGGVVALGAGPALVDAYLATLG